MVGFCQVQPTAPGVLLVTVCVATQVFGFPGLGVSTRGVGANVNVEMFGVAVGVGKSLATDGVGALGPVVDVSWAYGVLDVPGVVCGVWIDPRPLGLVGLTCAIGAAPDALVRWRAVCPLCCSASTVPARPMTRSMTARSKMSIRGSLLRLLAIVAGGIDCGADQNRSGSGTVTVEAKSAAPPDSRHITRRSANANSAIVG